MTPDFERTNLFQSFRKELHVKIIYFISEEWRSFMSVQILYQIKLINTWKKITQIKSAAKCRKLLNNLGVDE